MKLSINTVSSYDVIIGYNLLESFDINLNIFDKDQLFILCFSSSLENKSNSLLAYLKEKKYNIKSLKINDGESQKDLNNVEYVINQLVELGANKNTVLLAFGGGSIGDLVGFISSVYMRGIYYVNIPTTLLSMVDSSLGGKTAINYAGIKNIIGSFYQPARVCIDPSMLKTLSSREIRSGMGEVIKYGLINNYVIIQKLLQNYNCIIQQKNKDLMLDIILDCCSVKKFYIESDEKDKGIRNILNFGHTLGHVIESKYQSEAITHGEAIINGMFLAIELSYFKKVMPNDVYSKIKNMYKTLNIDYTYKLDKSDIENIKYDKKQFSNKYRFILLKNIGEPIICDDISKDDILNII